MTDLIGKTCTFGGERHRCGEPAVSSFVAGDGTVYYECAKHDTSGLVSPNRDALRVGDHVKVHRYGNEYDAVVTKVGARGAAYATFTYQNGVERTVRV